MRTWLALALIALASCAKGDTAERRDADLGECDGMGDEQILVARSLVFSRQDAGVSQGFDLDGADTTGGCGVQDYTDPEGTPNIDNAMAALIPVLETTEAAALEPLVQDSVNGGALLLMFDLSDLDSLTDDACVEVDVFKGAGIPMIGADGWILPNQTLDVDPETPITAAPVATMTDGRLDIGPIDEVWLSIVVLDLDATFALSNVQVRLEPQEDGTWVGMIAGGIKLSDIVDVVTLQNVSDEVFDLIGPVLELVADLEPDETGQCTQLSMTLLFEAVPAFVYEE